MALEVKNPNNGHKYEIRDGVVVFPDVLDRLPPSLAGPHVKILTETHRGYEHQKLAGFYPFDLTSEEVRIALDKNPRLRLGGSLLRRNDSGQLIELQYRADPEFKQIFDNLAHIFGCVNKAAKNLHEENLIKNDAEILKSGYLRGDAYTTMQKFINQRQHPMYGIWSGFLDRLTDSRHANWLDMQAWSTITDPGLSATFNIWSKTVLHSWGIKNPLIDFIVCDAVGQAGAATNKIWQGNALPSQSSIQREYGSLIYLFDNVSAMKTENRVVPVMERVLPEERVNALMAPGALDVARRIVLAAHEIGHAAHIMPSDSQARLGKSYQVLREAFAEAFAMYAISHNPGMLFSEQQIPMLMDYFIARSEVDFNSMREMKKKNESLPIPSSNPYPYVESVAVGAMLESDAANRSDRMYLDDVRNLRLGSSELIARLNRLTLHGSEAEVEDFVMKSSEWAFAA